MIKVYFAGTCSNRGMIGPTGIGVQCIDARGVERYTISKQGRNGSRYVAEYLALIAAMESLLQHGVPRLPVSFLGDAELVVNQVKGTQKCDELTLRELLAEVKVLISKFKSPIRIARVTPQESATAIQLSKDALKVSTDIIISSKR